MRPGLYFNKDNGITVYTYYINFSPACPPVSGYDGPVFTGKIVNNLILAGITGLLRQLRF